ncbi:glycosyltransferase [uncultured Methanolobus sp.]|uniref:glycosyltransferase n=1 Tax=uncultured Methanolobus sp. TaxID=218300 RepID=UPI0029C872F1|nr:glycosyltransferase [uncultured Methanolobus sp.]
MMGLIMTILLFDQKLIPLLEDVNNGGVIRKYFSQKSLRENGHELILVNSFNDLYLKYKCIFDKSNIFWLHYPANKKVIILALFLSLIQRTKIILTIHDSPIEQRLGVSSKRYHLHKKYLLKLTELILLLRSSDLIFATPELIKYFKISNQRLFVMPPGIGEEEIQLIKDELENKIVLSSKKKALYFGSMMRSGAIERLKDVFTTIPDWELILVGPLEGSTHSSKDYQDNIMYLGQKSHKEILFLFQEVDVILIPYPQNDYMNISMPIKLGYAFSSCKPIISTPLRGIKEYSSIVKLEQNIFYLDNFFDYNELVSSLDKVTSILIDKEYTLSQMGNMIWEQRLAKIIKIAISSECVKDEINDHNFILV